MRVTDITLFDGRVVATTVPRRNNNGDFYPVGYLFRASVVGKKLSLTPLPCPKCGATGSPITTNDTLTLEILPETMSQGARFDYNTGMQNQTLTWLLMTDDEKIRANQRKMANGESKEFGEDTVGTWVTLRHPITTKGQVTIPEGSKVFVEFYGKGFNVVSEPCPHCGLRHGVPGVPKRLMKLA